jgi:hypothetical protein
MVGLLERALADARARAGSRAFREALADAIARCAEVKRELSDTTTRRTCSFAGSAG